MKFWLSRFVSGNFNVENSTRSGKPIVEEIAKILDIVEYDCHVSTISTFQEGNKKKLEKTHGPNFHLRPLLNSNKIYPFLKRLGIKLGDLRHRQTKTVVIESRSKRRPSQGLTIRKILLCLLRLAANNLLWPAPLHKHSYFGSEISTIGPSEGSNRQEVAQWEWNYVPSGKHQATHIEEELTSKEACESRLSQFIFTIYFLLLYFFLLQLYSKKQLICFKKGYPHIDST